MASLIERRAGELRIKRQALRAELDAWREVSKKGAPLEKHNSQVRRIASVIDGLLDRVAGDVPVDAPNALGKIRSAEEKLLTAHTIWDFFRSRLAQRLDTNYRDHLRVCDELAWECYRPARDRFLVQQQKNASANAGTQEPPGSKEPPLVFLNAGWSPFAIGRDTAFQVDQIAGGWIAQETFREVVDRLPVPLIGLPWYQVAHLPDTLVIAHEVGHIVEWDFGLRTELLGAVARANVPADRREAWTAWQPEVFADLYGCLACGPAFAASLSDFCAVDSAKAMGERRAAPEWGSYPPSWLRLHFLSEALRALGFEKDADELEARRITAYGEPHHNTEFAPDAAHIAASLLDCKSDSLDVKIREILPKLGTTPDDVAENLAYGYAAGSEDTRALLAAARRLWERDPGKYVAKKRDDEIRSLVKTPPGTRRGSPEDDLPAREKSDREAGAALLDELFPGRDD